MLLRGMKCIYVIVSYLPAVIFPQSFYCFILDWPGNQLNFVWVSCNGAPAQGAAYVCPVSYTHLDVYKRQSLSCDKYIVYSFVFICNSVLDFEIE